MMGGKSSGNRCEMYKIDSGVQLMHSVSVACRAIVQITFVGFLTLLPS
jgi:hypothetical protein